MNYGIIGYILGWVLTIESLFMFLPCIIAAIYREETGWTFLTVAVIGLLTGFIITRRKPKNTVFFTREGFVIVSLSWILMSIVGAIPFVLNGDIPNFTNALFETISGFTTTGASILADVEALSKCSLFWRSFTHWIGGMGVLVFLLAILPMTGGHNMHLMRAESTGPAVGKLVPKVKETAKILYMIYFCMTVVQIVLLLIAGMPWFDAVTTAVGTAGTGGFGIKADSMAGYSPAIQWIVTIFMILFGVNFNMYYLLLGKNKLNAFKLEEVRWYFVVILVSTGIITANIASTYSNLSDAVRDAAFQVGSIITTTGFATTDFVIWPMASQVILVILMFLGACAGSTGGGVKISRIVIMLKAVKQEVMYLLHPKSVKMIKMDDKALDKSVVRNVTVFLATYVLIYIVSLILVSFDNFDFTTTFTGVMATLNNIGPGLGAVGPAGNFDGFSDLSKYVLMFDMLAGRLELYPMLLLLTPAVWKKN
ncbi:MAG: TrkH family potassium uptake protein [Lachnospiraceae bacterium]|nr:TrkH family potassium uptake protein [Lachnospiraceae bacterium]